MTVASLTLIVLFLSALAYRGALRKLNRQTTTRLKCKKVFYGWYVALWCSLPSLLMVLVWLAVLEPYLLNQFVTDSLPEDMPDVQREFVVQQLMNSNLPLSIELEQVRASYLRFASGSTMLLGIVLAVAFLLSLVWALSRVGPGLQAQRSVEKFLKAFLFTCSTVAVLTTLGIMLSMLFETLRFFSTISPLEFFFGTHWSPLTAIHEDQVGASGSFGAVPLFTGTLLISFIAMLIAIPTGLLSAIYLSEYADQRLRQIVKPILEILAGIPTVVYGFFAALTIAPLVRSAGTFFGFATSSENALSAGIVMGFMIMPFISSLSDDVIKAVPQNLRDGSYGLGATKHETITKVVLPAALPGIIGSILLAVSRAIGETMIVVMAAGLAAHLTANPLESVSTVTVQIVALLVGDQEFDGPKTLAAFALGMTLFVMTFILNALALYIVRKHRTVYD